MCPPFTGLGFVRVVVSESRGMGMPFAYSPEFRSMVVEQMRDGRGSVPPSGGV